MDNMRSVALVGQPNVGKSRLFNSLARRRIAIVHDQPGVTRDVNAVEVGGSYMLMDTGGIGLMTNDNPSELMEAIEEQVFFAIQAAGIILFVVDGKEGCNALDEMIAEKLRKFGKRPVLVVNKIDLAEHADRRFAFSHLGFEEMLPVSAEHGRGIERLREVIDDRLGPLPPKVDTESLERVKICFAGRPNVGKSSLCNALLESDRMIVSETPGTTRDSVELDLDYQRSPEEVWGFRLVDTAGVRRSGKVGSPVEYFSAIRSERAVESADVAFLVLDAREGVTRQDKLLAGKMISAGRALAVLVNKWDVALEQFSREPLSGYEDEHDFRRKFAKAVRRELFFMPDSEIHFVSALKKYALEKILETARRLDRSQSKALPTARVNRLISELTERHPPPLVKGKRFKIYYAVQVSNRPFLIRLFCNQAAHLDERYQRFLETGFLSEFKLKGCPVRFQLIGKPARRDRFFTPPEKILRKAHAEQPPKRRAR